MRNRFLNVLMRWLGRILVLWGILLGPAGCGQSEKSSPEVTSTAADTASSAPTGEKPLDYHFQLKYEDMWGVTTLTVNGFPVHQSGGGHITDNPVLSIGLNTGLIGSGNRVSVEVEPMILGGKKITIGPVEVHGEVTRDYQGEFEVEGAAITEAQVDSVYEAWSERARAKWKEYRSKQTQAELDSMRAWAERNPLTVSTTFDNEAGPDFSRIFEEAPVITDKERLRDYAIHLRDLLQAGDAEAIYEEFRPSVSKDLGWFKITRSGRRDSAIAHIRTDWTERWQTDFTRSEVALRRWSGGRVWELLVREEDGGLRPFFEGDAATSLDVYVAEIDGELKVVR